jgi:hypothetical protein
MVVFLGQWFALERLGDLWWRHCDVTITHLDMSGIVCDGLSVYREYLMSF